MARIATTTPNGTVGGLMRVLVEAKTTNIVIRVLMIVSGVILAPIAIAMMFTLIGFVAGLPLMLLAGGLVVNGATPNVHIACPYCEHTMPVRISSLNATCPKCKQTTVIDWR